MDNRTANEIYSEQVSGCILVVDDSATIRASIALTLPNDFIILEASNGKQAWVMLQENDSIDLVITDLDMPELNGFELIDTIRKSNTARFANLPIIVLTGTEDTETKQLAFTAGASDFVSKKADKVELVARIRVHKKLAQIIRDLEKNQHKLKVQAETDPLTGLTNRRCFFKEANELFDMMQKYGTHFSVVMLDIDNFKNINDTYGHQAGDTVLVELAKILTNNIRTQDVLARIGGEEFCVAAPNASVLSSVVLAERLRNAVESSKFEYDKRRIPVTISLGVANTEKEKQTMLDKLMAIADQRLYIAKHKGRNRLCASSSEMQNEQFVNETKSCISLDQALTMLKHGNYDYPREHLDFILTEVIPFFELGNSIQPESFDVELIRRKIVALKNEK